MADGNIKIRRNKRRNVVVVVVPRRRRRREENGVTSVPCNQKHYIMNKMNAPRTGVIHFAWLKSSTFSRNLN